MHPYLLEWTTGSQLYRLPSYGVLLALAFTFSYLYALWRCHKVEVPVRDIENIFLIVIFSSLLGSRLFHVFFEDYQYYSNHPERILMVWEGGFTFYGALLPALTVIWIYCKAKKIEFLRIADLAAVACALGLGIGRLGCFLAGCCWGKATSMPWGIAFHHPDSFSALKHVPLHPTQLYESFLGFTLFFFLNLRLGKKVGETFFMGLFLYSIGRFGIEFFRGDEYRGFVFGGILSFSQFISLVFFPLILIALARRLQRS